MQYSVLLGREDEVLIAHAKQGLATYLLDMEAGLEPLVDDFDKYRERII